MFAEGEKDRAQLLTSSDGIHWTWVGFLDVRRTDGTPLSEGPYGTPTAWFADERWWLMYERGDKAVWLASSPDLKTWTNVQDDPILSPGPEKYDNKMIAANQILVYHGQYYIYYHGLGDTNGNWTTNIATSTDLRHWKKYEQNPLFPVEANKSSGIVVLDGNKLRLYTMHNQVQLHFPRK
jgi:sucrose-6-phosphate hydrolase SacC (GH32 family)